ncbi:hypothetical protein MRX96_023610 [Rhipicephalus microplus]
MEPCLAVDEMIIPFKDRHSLKVYMMKRPKKWGYKVWTLAGRSGYVYKFELYGDNLVSEPTGLQNTIGESGKIVVRFTEGCAGKEVFCNNFFASAELLAEMKLCGLGCTSTLRSGRTGRCPLQNEKELKGNGRGSSDFRREKENGLVICQWYDNRTVTIGSNKHSVNPVGSCRRCDRKNKSFLEVQRLSLVRVYNQSMGGVDRADQLPAFYRNDLKTKKWYKRVVFHLLDLAIVNSWLLYRATKGLSMQLADYKLQIPLGLMKAEQATEDAKEQRKLGSTRLSNRASDIPGAVSAKQTGLQKPTTFGLMSQLVVSQWLVHINFSMVNTTTDPGKGILHWLRHQETKRRQDPVYDIYPVQGETAEHRDITGLEPGTEYLVQVAAVCQGGRYGYTQPTIEGPNAPCW